jgi:O-methyltransferase involved in polyketide biosynthesis
MIVKQERCYPVNDELAALRGEFPKFRIWQEIIGDRTRYIARGGGPGISPHTVVTGELGELREALSGEAGQQAAPVPADGRPPNIARVYNYWLGGKDHFAADRKAADSVLADFPEIALVARANRDFVTRAVRHVAGQGITQFIDVGAGLPASPAVHEAAQEIAADARVAYVDNDPLVLAHARALLAGGPGVIVVNGDMREPEEILGDRALHSLIDLDQPVCVLLASVLHFLSAEQADATVAALRERMSPGSYLVISAGTSTGTDPTLIRSLQDAYADATPVIGRTADEIAAWFDGFSLARPGLTDVWAWRPSGPQRVRRPEVAKARFLAGVGRKALINPSWQP